MEGQAAVSEQEEFEFRLRFEKEQAAPQEPSAKPSERVASYFKGKLSPLGGLEAAASLVSGAVAGPAAGIAGLVQGALNTLGGGLKAPREGMPAGDRVRQVLDQMTYQPQTEAGEGLTKAISYPFMKLAELGDFAGGKTTDVTGSPGAGTLANTTLQALPMALGRVMPASRVAPKTPQRSLYDTGIVKAKEAGYVLPPTQANPSIFNQIVEGVSGKIKTSQAASIKNQEVTNGLVRKGLGLAEDAPLTVETLGQVRKQAGQAYERVRNSGTVVPDPVYSQTLDAIAEPYLRAAKDFPDAAETGVLKAIDSVRVKSFDAGSAVDQIRILRDKADSAFRSGDKGLGKTYRGISDALEEQLGRHLEGKASPQVLTEFRKSREVIAKSYIVEKHLNKAGHVDAQGLARELKKGRLTGELKTAGEFGEQFHRAAQRPERVGGVPMSLFDIAVGGVPSAMMMDPSYLALVAARPAVRSLVLSGPYQKSFVNPQSEGPSMGRMLLDTQRQPLIPLSEVAEGQRRY
jgi:hypothetical protein